MQIILGTKDVSVLENLWMHYTILIINKLKNKQSLIRLKDAKKKKPVKFNIYLSLNS